MTDNFSKGIIKSIFCDAIWTQYRLARAGYEVEQGCAKCGADQDSVYHRCWTCPASSETRERIAGRSLCNLAEQCGPGKPRHGIFSRLLAEHPADRYPLPLAAGGVFYEQFDDEGYNIDTEGQMITVQGELFVDGSCSRSKVKDMQRAGWALVEFN